MHPNISRVSEQIDVVALEQVADVRASKVIGIVPRADAACHDVDEVAQRIGRDLVMADGHPAVARKISRAAQRLRVCPVYGADCMCEARTKNTLQRLLLGNRWPFHLVTEPRCDGEEHVPNFFRHDRGRDTIASGQRLR